MTASPLASVWHAFRKGPHGESEPRVVPAGGDRCVQRDAEPTGDRQRSDERALLAAVRTRAGGGDVLRSAGGTRRLGYQLLPEVLRGHVRSLQGTVLFRLPILVGVKRKAQSSAKRSVRIG